MKYIGTAVHPLPQGGEGQGSEGVLSAIRWDMALEGGLRLEGRIGPALNSASLLAHLRVVAHFHSLHQEQNIFGNVGGVISEAL